MAALRKVHDMPLRTIRPNAMLRNVAIEMPKMPARMPGTTRDLQPLAVAIPHAVVGPPTLALEAMSSSFLSNFSSFPTPRMIMRWITI